MKEKTTDILRALIGSLFFLLVLVPFFLILIPHQIYIAGALVLAGEALLFQSLGILIYSLIMFAIFNAHVFIEEAELVDRFGSTYERYRKSVPRWIPRLKPYDDNDGESL